jgi:hypothetical protein
MRRNDPGELFYNMLLAMAILALIVHIIKQL